MKRKNKTMVLVFVLLVSILFISGCVGQQSEIKSPEDAVRVVTNVSSGIEDVGSVLEDIDRTLGGT